MIIEQAPSAGWVRWTESPSRLLPYVGFFVGDDVPFERHLAAMDTRCLLSKAGKSGKLKAMRKVVYIETSIVSYLTAQPSRDLRAAAWQQITAQWWAHERDKYDLCVSALVVAEASQGDPEASRKRLQVLADLPELTVDDEVERFAAELIAGGGVPNAAEGDAVHIAIAAVHEVDYLLTWNCRHIDNAATKPIIRSLCAVAGYACPEICTPLELLSEEWSDA